MCITFLIAIANTRKKCVNRCQVTFDRDISAVNVFGSNGAVSKFPRYRTAKHQRHTGHVAIERKRKTGGGEGGRKGGREEGRVGGRKEGGGRGRVGGRKGWVQFTKIKGTMTTYYWLLPKPLTSSEGSSVLSKFLNLPVLLGKQLEQLLLPSGELCYHGNQRHDKVGDFHLKGRCVSVGRGRNK